MQNKPAHSSTSLNWFGGSQSLLIAYRWKTKETNWYCWYYNDSKFTMSSMVGLRIYILIIYQGEGTEKGLTLSLTKTFCHAHLQSTRKSGKLMLIWLFQN